MAEVLGKNIEDLNVRDLFQGKVNRVDVVPDPKRPKKLVQITRGTRMSFEAHPSILLDEILRDTYVDVVSDDDE